MGNCTKPIATVNSPDYFAESKPMLGGKGAYTSKRYGQVSSKMHFVAIDHGSLL